MAGNSKRKGAMRNPGSKKGAVVGSGGQKSKGLQGKGPTPKASDRPNHPAYKRAKVAAKPTEGVEAHSALPETPSPQSLSSGRLQPDPGAGAPP